MIYQKILIIHQSPSFRSHLESFLRSELKGIIIRSANSKGDAELLLQEQSFDLILSSTFMEVRDQKTRVIHLSSENLEEDELRYEAMKTMTGINTPGAKAVFHLESGKIEVDMIRFCEHGALCEVELPEIKPEELNHFYVTLSFPAPYGKVEDIRCCDLDLVELKNINSNRKRYQLVLLFPLLNEELHRVYKRILEGPVLKPAPTSKPKAKKSKKLIALTALFLFVLPALLLLFLNKEKASILWTDGNVFYRQTKNRTWQQAFTNKEYRRTSWFKMSEPTSTVISYDDHEIALLTKGGKVHRIDESGNDSVSYRVQGAFHLLVDHDEAEKGHEIKINNFSIQVKKAHIFYHNLSSPSELYIASGSAYLSDPENSAVPLPLMAKATIFKNGNGFKIKKSAPGKIFKETYIPGFETLGLYRHVGYAELIDGGYQLEREGKLHQVTRASLPIQKGDRIINGAEGNVMITLSSNDQLKIYPETSLSIDVSSKKSGSKLPLLMIGAPSDKPDAVDSYSFDGKLRVKVVPGPEKKIFRFQSKNAIITSEGGEFVASAKNSVSEVLGITGTLTISDRKGRHQIRVPEGMMSNIVANATPSTPVKIPKERLLQLKNETFDEEADFEFSYYEKKQIRENLNFVCKTAGLNPTETEKEKIKAFQQQQNIKVDGIIGPETLGKIKEVLNCPTM